MHTSRLRYMTVQFNHTLWFSLTHKANERVNKNSKKILFLLVKTFEIRPSFSHKLCKNVDDRLEDHRIDV